MKHETTQTDYGTWREIAFSHRQIQDFLSIVALPHYEVRRIMPFQSELNTCFCIGFYFFCRSIRGELGSPMGEELLNLAVRVEKSSESVWDQNAEEARRLLARYFADVRQEAERHLSAATQTAAVPPAE